MLAVNKLNSNKNLNWHETQRTYVTLRRVRVTATIPARYPFTAIGVDKAVNNTADVFSVATTVGSPFTDTQLQNIWYCS